MPDYELILEIGVNHENDLQNAIKLINSAKNAGAKIVKFQTYTAEKIAAKKSPSYWDSTGTILDGYDGCLRNRNLPDN